MTKVVISKELVTGILEVLSKLGRQLLSCLNSVVSTIAAYLVGSRLDFKLATKKAKRYFYQNLRCIFKKTACVRRRNFHFHRI